MVKRKSVNKAAGCAVVAIMALTAFLPVSAAQARATYTSPALAVSGFIEADEVAIASELGGRILDMPIDVGGQVKAGDVLAQLDPSVVQAEVGVVQAGLAAARAALAQVKAGARPELIRQAEAAVKLAEATRDAAKQTWEDAELLASEQQALDLQIVQARWQVEIARKRLDAAVAALQAAEITRDRLEQPMEDYRYWQSWITVNSAGAAYDGAVALLDKLQAERASPVAQRARANAAKSAYEAAVAEVAQAQARLRDTRAGPTPEQVRAAEAQVRVAEANVKSVEARKDKLTVRAPGGGAVLSHDLLPGEIAGPGATILTLANLDTLRLVVYVPANRLDLVQLGQELPVQVDGLPGRTFTGKVVHIADKAEFVPSNVQSPEDRVSQVYGVKLELANPDRALKPGVPADALLGGE